MKTLLLASAIVLALGTPALAQEHMDHGAAGAGSAATEAYMAANAQMHMDMDIEFSDDTCPAPARSHSRVCHRRAPFTLPL